jgi:hypothetical protein
LFRDFSAKAGKENFFNPTNGNESLHEISNDNLVRVVDFTISKNLIVKSTMFPHRNIPTDLNTTEKWFSGFHAETNGPLS